MLAELGYREDPRLRDARQFFRSKQDGVGRWLLEKTLDGKTWLDVEERGQRSEWITLRALRTLAV